MTRGMTYLAMLNAPPETDWEKNLLLVVDLLSGTGGRQYSINFIEFKSVFR